MSWLIKLNVQKLNWDDRDFLDDPVVKNPPTNSGDTGSISGQGTKVPHATGQVRLRVTTRQACA